MLRWENYFLKSGSGFDSFWSTYISNVEPDILFIMGIGFDPRTNNCIKSIYSFPTCKLRDTIAIRYYKNEEDVLSGIDSSVATNWSELLSFLNSSGNASPNVKNVFLRSDEDKSVTSINAYNVIANIDALLNYSDIVIDISAMPRDVFLPIINKCLVLIDRFNNSNSIKKNLHVVVSENSKLDSIIYNRGLDEEPTYVRGFGIKQIDKTADQNEVWMPILGEKQTEQFDKIKGKLNPVEVCPVLPFPSENMRRGDELIVEYQDRLFNDSDFEPRNIVYVDESNPFQTYRILSQMIKRYDKSFNLLNGCKIIVSALSSKLLTVGAFLAVFEKKQEKMNVGIMHVESLGSEVDPDYYSNKEEYDNNSKMFEIWLAGAPYYEL